MIKLKVGDKVKHLKRKTHNIGTVIEFIVDSVLIKFKGWDNGHSGYSTDSSSREHWYYENEDIHHYVEKIDKTWKERMIN